MGAEMQGGWGKARVLFEASIDRRKSLLKSGIWGGGRKDVE